MKRKRNTLYPREDEKKQKLRITRKNYQANKEEEKEKCKNEEQKKSQEERKEVLDAERLLENTHILNE